MTPDPTRRKVLLFGCRGQLGREFIRAAAGGSIEITALCRKDVDIVDRRVVTKAFRDHPCDIVVNAAAYTAVDKAEDDRANAFAINSEGPGLLAQLCRDYNIPLVHFSTDYVFDGKKTQPYEETDSVNPINVYGASKAAGEQAIREVWKRHFILRTSWLFSSFGSNFVKTMLRVGDTRRELQVVDDQVGCPTSARSVAAAVLRIISMGNEIKWGTYHYCGAGRASWYDFAKEIFSRRAEITGLEGPLLRGVATAEYPTPARRPTNSELDCSLFANSFGIEPRPWPNDLIPVLRELLKTGHDQ